MKFDTAFAIEISRAKRKAIQKIYKSNGEIADDSISEVLYEYYHKLFSEHKIDEASDFLEDIVFPQVKPEDQAMLNAPISLAEIDIAVAQLECDKVPGLDGITINLIRRFYPIIKHTLHSVYLKAVNENKMFGLMKEGTISLMEKLTRNPLYISNWRPLSILNSDYKIYAKIIADRLQMVLPYLIHYDQSGFMKGRNIANNLSNLLTVIEYCQQNEVKVVLTAIDFEKAFDTVSWKAMRKVLHAFGFQDTFINMIFLCYEGFEVNVSNNGFFTEFLKIERGNKQGCPLSALNFLLIVETVALKLRQNKHIKLVNIHGLNKLLGQYADDLWTAMMYDKKSFDEQMLTFKKFQLFSGLCINYNKTEIMRLGACTGSNAKIYSKLPLIWSDSPMRILGIKVFPRCEDIVNSNYQNTLDKVDNIFKTWKWRNLSLIGKVQLVNTLAIA